MTAGTPILGIVSVFIRLLLLQLYFVAGSHHGFPILIWPVDWAWHQVSEHIYEVQENLHDVWFMDRFLYIMD